MMYTGQRDRIKWIVLLILCSMGIVSLFLITEPDWSISLGDGLIAGLLLAGSVYSLWQLTRPKMIYQLTSETIWHYQLSPAPIPLTDMEYIEITQLYGRTGLVFKFNTPQLLEQHQVFNSARYIPAPDGIGRDRDETGYRAMLSVNIKSPENDALMEGIGALFPPQTEGPAGDM